MAFTFCHTVTLAGSRGGGAGATIEIREAAAVDRKNTILAMLRCCSRVGDSPAGTDGDVRSQNGPNSLVGIHWDPQVISAD